MKNKIIIALLTFNLVFILQACKSDNAVNTFSQSENYYEYASLYGDFSPAHNFEYVIKDNNAVIVSYIGDEKTVVIPETLGEYKVTELEYDCFRGNDDIRIVVVPKTVKNIGEGAFSNCKALRQVVMQYGLESIGDSAFAFCPSLHISRMPDSVHSIGDKLFKDCTLLSEVVLSKGIDGITFEMFDGCLSLENIELDENISYIDRNAFYGCKKLEVIKILQSVSEIGVGAFDKCSASLAFNTPLTSKAAEYANENNIYIKNK